MENTLPIEVLTAIEAAHIMHRTPSDDGSARIIVRMVGLGSWTHDGQATHERLAGAFPELSEAQLDRAYRYLVNRIVAANREKSGGRSRFGIRNSWATNW